MILRALVEYYERCDELADEGWQWKRIPFVVEIERDGTFVQLTSLQFGKSSSEVTPSLVPKAEIRSGTKAYEKPNSLWDHLGFVLGYPKDDSAASRKTAAKQHEHFLRRVRDLANRCPSSAGLHAISEFYASEAYKRVLSDPLWPECIKIPGCNMTFRLVGSIDTVALEPEVRQMLSTVPIEEESKAICLVTGELQPTQRVHFPIAGVCEKPAPLAAVNDGSVPAFASFGKSQGDNFPVGERSAFRYAEALNHMLRPGSRQRMQVGDASTVFWAQKAADAEIEEWFATAFGDRDDPSRTEKIRALFESIQSGKFDGANARDRFYVLGLAPNAARIAIRFWHSAALKDIAQRIRRWFDDLRIARGPNDPEFPSLFRLLSAVAVLGKAENIPPSLGGQVMASILSGGPYPVSWLGAAVRGSRAEQQVTYYRAAAIKACLNRAARERNSINDGADEEIAEMLDASNKSIAYRLGRLFAVLEKIQEEASPGLNATIRDRYYGAASATPVVVFTTLLRLKNHHIAKLENRGRAVNLEKQIAEIVSEISAFPSHLALQDQGRFALGYYHQRQAFFTRQDSNSTNTVEGTPQ